ncbi:MAG: putative selenate reductase subunit YgfK [Bacteroidales bacterium]|nr:putative selenate reductase subunit YgfK [Bacteroidales bacterium]
MTDKFFPLPLTRLLSLILNQYDKTGFIFSIPKELFFYPKADDSFRFQRFGQLLESPVGVAAGPHTQLAQNIVAAWLTGARFIELKTIQTLDELEVSKPCIDMQDEGYNCEWSQELKIHQSFDQYLDAWILIHILKDKLKIGQAEFPGFIFNMSVGYNLSGILNDNVQWFFDKMKDASGELAQKIEQVKHIYPNIARLRISPWLSDNITLSTMHGCPPDEIEKIGEYLLNEKKLHTAIKLNPTLIGKSALHDILSKSGFDTIVPDMAFDHDLKYPDAIRIIQKLKTQAGKQNLQFSIKLTNTLESKNHKSVFDESQKMMYMSGRALHPISVNLAGKLQNEFSGALDISFSGGADAFNVVHLLHSGLAPVTVCTDLLKPGSYGRLHQYIENIREAEFDLSIHEKLNYLNNYALKVLNQDAYHRKYIKDQNLKTSKRLNDFDCIHAPCETTCPTHQGIPDYLFHASEGDFAKAAEIVAETNPFPKTTGMVCDHLCQTKCTRLNYDSPVLIREVKRVIAENAPDGSMSAQILTTVNVKPKVAIIGAGPSGLSCAYFLAKAGFEVGIFESKSKPGGMVSGAIPSFRLTDEAINIDVNRILGFGVEVHYNAIIDKTLFSQLKNRNDFIYVAAGAQKSRPLGIQGGDAKGVADPLEFLFDVKSGNKTWPGKNVVIIGGGNTAMDAARTAWRVVGENGKVTIIYRRTIKDMPADLGEIMAVVNEGVEIIELVSPVKINTHNGAVSSITVRKMKQGEKDESGRFRPVEIPGSDYDIFCDIIIPAIGQELAFDFLGADQFPAQKGSYETKVQGVFVGGDALRGASTAINAIADGRLAAQQIIDKAGINFQTKTKHQRPEKSFRQHIIDKSRRTIAQKTVETSLDDRKNFKMVQSPFTPGQGIEEAKRCLRCDEVCSVCTIVCPNLALINFEVEPCKIELQKISVKNGMLRLKPYGVFEITQKYQILHLADWCNKCGNCNTFCPTSGAPYLDKPHLFLNRNYFESENDGFYLDGEILYGKVHGENYSLESHGTGYIFKNIMIAVILGSDLSVKDCTFSKEHDFEIELKIAAKMFIILQGAKQMS